ncbi:MAG TPA: peptidyl-prolyl cis-trans isomerase [Neobacillus sp.]|jgi:hypothetical protein
MENIIVISGKVKYMITLDPGVWIFDDRRLDLTTYFFTEKGQADELEEYKKAVSKHWDREIMEGSTYPPTLKSEKKFEKEKVLTGTFGIPFKPFLDNSEPLPDASSLIISTTAGEIEIPLSEANELILGFSNQGKPLSADGPVYVYYGNGSNQKNPIKNVKEFKVK